MVKACKTPRENTPFDSEIVLVPWIGRKRVVTKTQRTSALFLNRKEFFFYLSAGHEIYEEKGTEKTKDYFTAKNLLSREVHLSNSPHSVIFAWSRLIPLNDHDCIHNTEKHTSSCKQHSCKQRAVNTILACIKTTKEI